MFTILKHNVFLAVKAYKKQIIIYANQCLDKFVTSDDIVRYSAS